MPVRKKDGKWYWGKQGPFDSKQKAEDVAQAAYASGYTKAWLTNPRGSTDDDKHGNADEELERFFQTMKVRLHRSLPPPPPPPTPSPMKPIWPESGFP